MTDSGADQRESLSQALTLIERQETALLSWGVVDSSFTNAELITLISEGLPEESAADVLDQLIDHVLVVKTPEGGLRSRMAETVRLLATLRQTFPDREWWEGAPLVLDQRFAHRPRSRPERNLIKQDFLARLAGQVSSAGYRVAEALAPSRLSGFQERSTKEILDALNVTADRGVVVTAGTGSGKSLAFYLPTLSWIGESISADPAHGVRCLAIYPRNELLKDQLATLIEQARTLQGSEATERPIVIGTWFGATPGSARLVVQNRYRDWAELKARNTVLGWRCPFLDCPSCGQPMVWPAADARTGRERLECTSTSCGVTFEEEIINLTRDRATERPADVLLTTTESINRQLAAPDQHKAFGLAGKARRVRLVLLDEIHIYEGTTGAQNALLLRRLRHVIGQPVTWVGLSATLVNADRFFEHFVGLDEGSVSIARPEPEEMTESGAEYLVALRHDPGWRTGPLSTTIQTAMLVPRCLDRAPASSPYHLPPSSDDLFGSRTFAFTDKLDVTNRLYWNLLDAEGWHSPGRPLRRNPLTLAHLRAEEQLRRPQAKRESPREREPTGQWWWLPEALDWDLDGDTQLTVGRTSSQDIGVSAEADVIVATATLEVGYDDNRVGAVLQHKAPHNAAQFLQRRGRAGRYSVMRPWTIVVLSSWGRDRQAWQLYEDLFDPELRPRSLPIGNRYVLRMQAVYALMDWLGGQLGQLGGNRSVWRDLVAPAEVTERSPQQQQDRLKRQMAAAELLNQILDGGLARERFRTYLRRALRLGSDNDDAVQAVLDALFWEPPRALLLTVIPTIVRRLRSGWAGEVPAENDPDVLTRTPLREFVAGNLFDDLLVPEVKVILPTLPRHLSREDSQLPALRALRELMPGNVTRHFGVYYSDRRHWLAPPQPIAAARHQDVDLAAAYGAALAARFADPGDPGREIYMFRPMGVRLTAPDDNGPSAVRDATTSAPCWGVQIEPLGAGQVAPLARGRWRDAVIAAVTFQMHGAGDGVRIRRYATGAKGALFHDKDPVPFEIGFTDARVPPTAAAALGIEMDVDGLCLMIKLPAGFGTPSRQERSDRLRYLITESAELPDELSWFERMPLFHGLQLVLAELDRPDPAQALAGLSAPDLADRLLTALEKLHVVRTHDGHQPGNDATVAKWCSDDTVLAVLQEAAQAAAGERDQDWTEWLRRRFAATVGTIFIGAMTTACPQVDTSDLAIDLEPRAGLEPTTASVWLTELAPGGTGQIEQLLIAMAEDPGRFARILEAATAPGDIEELDSSLRAFIVLIEADEPAREAAARLRDSWLAGHEAVSAALAALRAATAANGLELSRLAWTTINTRLLGPGAKPELPGALTTWLQVWDDAEARTRLALDPHVAGVVIAENDDVTDVLNLDKGASVQRKALAVANVLWARGGQWQQYAESATTFGTFPEPDLSLVRSTLGPAIAEMDVAEWNDTVRRELGETLLRDSKAVLRFPVSRASDARRAIVESQAEPIDLGGMFGYPNVVTVSQSERHIDVTFVLNEVAA
jgi:hypothetical protein